MLATPLILLISRFARSKNLRLSPAASVTALDSVTCVRLSIEEIFGSPTIPGPVTTIPTRSPDTLPSVTAAAETTALVTGLVSSGVVRSAAASIIPAVLKSNRSWIFDFPAHLPRSTRACRHVPVESKSSCTA